MIDWESEVNSAEGANQIRATLEECLKECDAWDQVLVIFRDAEPRAYDRKSAGVTHAHAVYMARWFEHDLMHEEIDE